MFPWAEVRGRPPAPPPSMQPPEQPHYEALLAQLTVDSPQARENRQRRKSRLQKVVVPLMRSTMLAAGVLFASAHNWILFDAAWSPELQLTAASYAVYALLSWVTLAALHRPEGTRDLARIFLRLDLIAATLLVACTGGAASWLFFVPWVRVADQVTGGVKRCGEFVPLCLLSHTAGIALGDEWLGYTPNWGLEALKIGGCATIALHVALTSRIAEKMRSRTRATLSLARDAISELRQKSEELENSRREAENASNAKGLFLANLSHEFRTPMNGIIGMTELTLDTELDRDQEEYVSTVQRSARNLLHIVNDVLDFSKIDSGAMHYEDLPFSIRGCVRDALVLTAAQSSVGDIEVTCDIDEEVADVVAGDESRLRQILVNLLSNSLKFTEEGFVSLRVTAGEEPDQLAFEVQDTGVGINREKLETIFEAFTQAEDSTTRRFGGTGLGLAISRDLCVGMGGQMEVESEEGRGSRFRFKLPLPPARSTTVRGAETGPLTVVAPRRELLLVVPRAHTRGSIARRLEAWGLAVHACGAPADARALIRSLTGPPLAIICSGALRPEEYLLLDSQLADLGPAPWVLLQAGELAPEPALPADRTQNLLLPIVGPELRAALCSIAASEPGASATNARRGRRVPRVRRSAHPQRVLLVEDDRVNQRVAELLLTSWGHQVEIAPNGAVATELTATADYDVVLMDIQMPVMDGLSATRKIRAREARAGDTPVRIIAMTANATPETAAECEDAGMDEKVLKPIDRDELFARLEDRGMTSPE